MRVFLILMLVPIALTAQPKYEVQEFTGVLKSFEPGLHFAFQYLQVEVDGKKIGFMVHPEYGQYLNQRIKLGDQITFRAQIDLRGREMKKKLETSKRPLPWFAFVDLVTDIKIDNKWIELPEVKVDGSDLEFGVFIKRRVIGEYKQGGVNSAVIFEGGIVATYLGSYQYPGLINSLRVGDLVSFGGRKMPFREGYKYPIEPVEGVYYFSPLKEYSGELYSFLFKQNSVCIGVRFNLSGGKKLDVSFPSKDATRIKDFLNRNEEKLLIYTNDYKPEGQIHPTELHALISSRDTLFIKEFGFYGGADGNHEHDPVAITGKITRINVSPKGSVSSLIINSDYYVEIDAMMAQQLARYFQKGKQISIQGKQRIKKEGEIYQKSYHIVVPERLTVDGKTFSTYNP